MKFLLRGVRQSALLFREHARKIRAVTGPRPLEFDAIAEARRQWEARDWPAPSAMAAATSIMRAQQIVQARVDDALRSFDLSFARYEALVLLYFSRSGALPLGKMGDRLMLHPTSVTNIVDRLEASGYAERTPHPTDRRTTLATITPEGRRITEKATESVSAANIGMGDLTVEELDTITSSLRRLRVDFGDFPG
jgi:DNA-binding MarR family transcriptional regulator